MVTCWLQHNYDTSCHGLPTWEKLVQVIGNPAGGNNTTLALTIAQQHNVSVQQPTQAHMAQGGYISQQSLDTSPGHGTIFLEHQNVSHASVSSDTSTIITDDPLSPTLQTDSLPHDTKLQTDLPPHYIKKPLLSAMTSEMLNLQELVSELNQEFITNSFKTKKYLKKHANFLDVREYIITHVISLTKLSDTRNEELLRQTFLEATMFEQLFEVLTKYTSWYNYDLIVKLSHLFLHHNHKLRRKWRKYEEKLKEYLTLGVGVKEYHGPIEFGENSNGDRKVFAVKVPSEKLVHSDLFTFHKALAKSLKETKFLLYFWSIQRGCLELKYLVPNFLSTDISNALPQAMTEYLPQLGISEVHWNGSRYVLDKVSYIILIQWAYNNLHYIRYQILCYRLQISCNN